MAGPWNADMEDALLHTALWTRPPVYKGLSLSDLWAWLRYYRAFSSSSFLSLSVDWSEIDAHQKTVASDDLGVGVTTYALIEKLGFTAFADTRRVVSILQGWGVPGVLLSSSNRRGPKKAPDYVALDSTGEVSAVECKGTQTSLKELESAMEGGREQKRSLTAPGLRYSLVAGLFIPQHNSDEFAEVSIADPDPPFPAKVLEERNHEFKYALLRVALAKHYSLKADLALANALTNPDATFRRALPRPLRERLKQDRTFLENMPFTTRIPLAQGDSVNRHLVFEMTGSDVIREAVLSDELELRLMDWHRSSRATTWKKIVREDQSGVDLHSPLGFRLSLFVR